MIKRLRYLLWTSHLDIGESLALPPVSVSFASSSLWAEQCQILRRDLERTPGIHHTNAQRILLRYACAMPCFGYSQGNLYVYRAICEVFDSEREVFWAFTRAMDIVNIYGPLNSDVKFRNSGLPEWVTREFTKHSPSMDIEWLHFGIQLRWFFLMWGQTCSTVGIQCSLMDYALQGRLYMYRLAAAMIRVFHSRVLQFDDPMEKFQQLFQIQIQTEEEAALIITTAATEFISHNVDSSVLNEHHRRMQRMVSRHV